MLIMLPRSRAALEAAWEDADLHWRKALLHAVLEAVVVNPAVKGRNFFDPARVELVWRA